MAFVEYTAPNGKQLTNNKRSTKDTATLKVKRTSVTIGIHSQFLEEHKLDFQKGMRIWFDPESRSIKIGVKEGADLKAKASESGYQSISIGRVLKSFGFTVPKSAFNLPIKANGDSLTINLADHVQSEKAPKKKSA